MPYYYIIRGGSEESRQAKREELRNSFLGVSVIIKSPDGQSLATAITVDAKDTLFHLKSYEDIARQAGNNELDPDISTHSEPDPEYPLTSRRTKAGMDRGVITLPPASLDAA